MDGRKNNGGNSTKALGVDKRKNPYKDVVQDSVSVEDLRNVLIMLCKKATDKGDVKAAQLVLEYTVGKPKQEVDVNSSEGLSFGFKMLLDRLDPDNK